MNNPITLFLLIILVTAVFFDLKNQKIPNWLTLGSLPIILVISFLSGGSAQLITSFLGAALAGFIWLFIWQLGLVGGGDQKLMMVVGASLGYQLVIPVTLVIAMVGGLQAIIFILIEKLKEPNKTLRDISKSLYIPYGLAIAAGVLLTLVLNNFHLIPQTLFLI